MAFTKFDWEVLQKAMGILKREGEFRAAEEINRVFWKERNSQVS